MNNKSSEIFVIINIDAGTVKEYVGGDLGKNIKDAFKNLNCEATVLEVPGSEINKTLDDCIKKSPGTIVGVGGDGTLSTIGGKLAGSEVAFGIIPLGTFNLFAKDYNIPPDLDDAAKIITAKNIRCIDIGEVNGRKFIYCSVMGLYPEVLRLREKSNYKNKSQKFIVMMKAFMKLLWIFPIFKFQISCSNILLTARTPIASISTQNMTLSKGRVTKKSIEDVGTLTLSIFKGNKGIKFFWVLIREQLGFLISTDEVEHIIDTDITIKSRPKNLYLAIDGELTKIKSPINFKVLPKSLNLIVPEEFKN